VEHGSLGMNFLRAFMSCEEGEVRVKNPPETDGSGL